MSSPARENSESGLLRPIARLLLVTQLVALVLLVAASALLVSNAARFQHANEWVARTHAVLDEVVEVRTAALRGAMALRNYAISPEKMYLDRARAAARDAADASERLESLVHDNDEQRDRAFAVRAEVAELTGWLNSSTVIAERDGVPALKDSLYFRAKFDSSRQLRELLASMETDERLQLQSRHAAQQQGFARLKRVTIMSLVGFGTFLVWTIVYSTTLFRRGAVDIRGLRESADRDPLTGLLNRRGLERRFPAVASSALTVVAFDLDRFKPINDRFGHPAGDEVLRASARRLVQECRDADLIARVGGDEFVIVLAGVKDPMGAARVCARIKAALCEPIRLDSATVAVGVSLGYTTSPGGAALDELLSIADAHAYAEKTHHGRGREDRPPEEALPGRGTEDRELPA